MLIPLDHKLRQFINGTVLFSAGETGHQEAEPPLQETLREEEAMASWIDGHLPDVTHAYLERYVADQKAGL